MAQEEDVQSYDTIRELWSMVIGALDKMGIKDAELKQKTIIKIMLCLLGEGEIEPDVCFSIDTHLASIRETLNSEELSSIISFSKKTDTKQAVARIIDEVITNQ